MIQWKAKKKKPEMRLKTGKDKMMKSTTIHERNMAFILSILQNQWGKDEEAGHLGV